MALEVESAFDYLKNSVSSERLSHAYLITGQQGSGKEELVLKIISLVNDTSDKGSLQEMVSDNVRLVQPESKSRRIKVDQIRELEDMFYQKGSKDKYKVGVIRDADRLGEQAENAFLKTLEEPPDRCLIFLVTAFPEQLLDTILSRCIQVPLKSRKTLIAANQHGDHLRKLLSQMPIKGSVSDALRLSRQFSDLLRAIKEESEKNQDIVKKSESAQYAKTTDGKWLKDREDYHKAISQSRYLAERSALVEVLISWTGDALRQKQNVGFLDFPENSEATSLLSDALSVDNLLDRVNAFEGLRSDLETNVQESLAIEVGFLNAFTESSNV